MSIPSNLAFLTTKQIDAITGRNVGSSGLLYAAAATALEIAVGAMVEVGNPINLVGAAAGIATFLGGLVESVGDDVGLALSVIQTAGMIEDKVNSKLQWALDEIEDDVREKPDSELFDSARWNKILGKAFNYGCSEPNMAVFQREDGSYDFTKQWGFKPDGIHQRWLSEELQYLLNCKMEAY